MELHFKPTDKSRKQLVSAMEQALGIEAKYLRVPTCAYQIGAYTVNKDGSLTIPDDTDSAEVSRIIAACKAAGFDPETNESAELAAEAPVSATEGLTISLPKDSFTDAQLANLRKLTASKANLICKALAIEDLPIIEDSEKVSFPWITYEPSARLCDAVTCLITAMCQMAKEAKRVTATEHDYDNDKYAFRCFLLRLGMIGDKYKQTRKILLKNLSGSSAFKTVQKEGDL